MFGSQTNAMTINPLEFGEDTVIVGRSDQKNLPGNIGMLFGKGGLGTYPPSLRTRLM